jgi:hypothetical protein
VGVDHAARCAGGGAEAQPFLVIVESGGGRREVRGAIPSGRFLARVLEFEFPRLE